MRWKSYHPRLRKKGDPSPLGVHHPDGPQRAVNADGTGRCPYTRPSETPGWAVCTAGSCISRAAWSHGANCSRPCPPGLPHLGPDFRPPCTSTPGPSSVPSLKVPGVQTRPPLPAYAPRTATLPSRNPMKSRRWQASDFRLAAYLLTLPDSEP